MASQGQSQSLNQTSNLSDLSQASVSYICGDCNSKVQLKKGDPVRCVTCGFRVLYKERTKRVVQFEAR